MSPPPLPDFNELYHAHSGRLVAQIVAYTQDLPLAEDLVQEAFCRALARWSRISRYDDPIGWVRRVAWNLASSHWRRSRRTRAIAEGLPDETVSGPSPDRIELMRALAMLPPNQRRVVIMFYLADMSLAAIADFERISENAVKQRLHRARISLTAELGSEVDHA